jgi:hypothetical protein
MAVKLHHEVEMPELAKDPVLTVPLRLGEAWQEAPAPLRITALKGPRQHVGVEQLLAPQRRVPKRLVR